MQATADLCKPERPYVRTRLLCYASVWSSLQLSVAPISQFLGMYRPRPCPAETPAVEFSQFQFF